MAAEKAAALQQRKVAKFQRVQCRQENNENRGTHMTKCSHECANIYINY